MQNLYCFLSISLWIWEELFKPLSNKLVWIDTVFVRIVGCSNVPALPRSKTNWQVSINAQPGIGKRSLAFKKNRNANVSLAKDEEICLNQLEKLGFVGAVCAGYFGCAQSPIYCGRKPRKTPTQRENMQSLQLGIQPRTFLVWDKKVQVTKMTIYVLWVYLGHHK